MATHPKPPARPLFALAALCALCAVPAPSASAAGIADAAPADAVMTMHLSVKESDPGQQWVFAELVRYFVARAREKGEAAPVGEMDLFRFSDFCFALLPRDREGRDRLLLAATLLPAKNQFSLTYGDQRFQLNIRDDKTAEDTQSGLLELLLRILCEVRAGSQPDDGIYFNREREGRGRFSAYSLTGSRAYLATGREIIRAARSGKDGIASSAPYKAAMDLLPSGWDAYGYANDEGGRLTAYLGEKEKGWSTLVLSLLDPARRMGLALDVEDKDHSRAVAVFPLSSPAEVKALRERLEKALRLLLAECLDPRLKAELSFEELPRALRVTGRLSDTAGFWEKAFGGKDKERRRKGAGVKPAAAAETRASTGAARVP